ncbi:MAG: flippase [Patescibacteria group bacterium]|jgi:O-antigen/teichoic acid export membrane protein
MNSSPNKTGLAKNILWATGAEMVSRLLLFVVILQLANYLLDTRYGELSYAFAVANICVMIADFGLSTYVVQQLAYNTNRTKELLSELLGVKLWLTYLSLLSMLIICVLVRNLNFTIVILGGGAIILNNTRMFLEAFFRAHQRLKLEAITKTVSALLLAVTLSVLVQQRSSVATIAAGYFFAALIGIVFTLILLRSYIASFKIRAPISVLKKYIRLTWPFAASLGCNYLMNYFDSALLGFFGKTTELGWYTAAYKPVFFLTALAGMLVNAFFPVITHQFHHAKANVQATVTKLLRLNSIIALPLAVGGSILAPTIMHLFYPNYPLAPLTLAFQILLWGTALIYIWTAFGNSLQACARQKDYLHGFLYATIINIVLNFIAIPVWSLYGAATATTIAQLFLLIYFYHKFNKHIVTIKLFKQLWKPAIAAGVMGLSLWFLPKSLWLIPADALIYVLVLFSLKSINKTELLQILKLWRKQPNV